MSIERPINPALLDPDLYPMQAPDGTPQEQAWWSEAPVPTELLTMKGVGDLISGHVEPGLVASPLLTSHLNAWLLKGSITRAEALLIQREVTANPKLENYRRVDPARLQYDQFWPRSALVSAHAVTALTGKTVGLSFLRRSGLKQAIGKGYVAVAGDDDRGRLLFQPKGKWQLYMYSPVSDQRCGFRDYNDLPYMGEETPRDYIVVM